MKNKIKILYKSGLSAYQIMQKLHIASKELVYNVIHEEKLTRDYEECRHPGLNSRYFKNIDTEEKAYILGLIFADGCVRKNRPGMTLALHPNDLYMLRRIKDILGTKAKIQISKQPLAVYYINNKQMRLDVIAKGCLPQKSLRGGKPKNIPIKYTHHFIRGIFDGDGSIYIRKVPHLRYCFDISGNIDVVSWCHKRLKLYTKITKHRSIFRLETTNLIEVVRIFNYLYKDSTIFLKRKKALFEKACAALDRKIKGVNQGKTVKTRDGQYRAKRKDSKQALRSVEHRN
jgi:hypothetical protein